jgi:hypothetical protein
MLIGLIGKARSGKSTVAAYWAEKHGAVILSFALPLKILVYWALLRNPPPGADNPDWEELLWTHRTPFTRWLLQFIGTDIIRHLDKDFFVDSLIDEYRHDLNSRLSVVTDVRFLNEATAIKNNGGIIVRVVREGHGDLIEAGATHISETELDSYQADFIISASEGVENLKLKADEVFNAICCA